MHSDARSRLSELGAKIVGMLRGYPVVVMTVVVALSTLPGSASAASPGTVNTLVQATLTSRVPLRATPGTRFALSWTLANSQGFFDPGGMTIFARLVSHDGRTTTTALAPPTPRPTKFVPTAPPTSAHHYYHVVVTVPRGGIGRIEIGGRMAHGVSGFFPITNDPLKH
jgi:hypothetical protein